MIVQQPKGIVWPNPFLPDIVVRCWLLISSMHNNDIQVGVEFSPLGILRRKNKVAKIIVTSLYHVGATVNFFSDSRHLIIWRPPRNRSQDN